MVLYRRGGRLCALSVLFLLLGCTEPDLSSFPSRPPQPFDEVKKEISRLRGLPFLQEVTLETHKLEEIRSLLAEPLEDAQKNSSLMAEIYKRLGLLPEAADFAKDLLDLRLFQHRIHYDARRRAIVVPEEPLKPDLAFLRFSGARTEETARQLLLAHALAHALQEQNFQWGARIRSQNTEDSKLTLRAVMQGDAVLVGLAYLAAHEERGKERTVEAVKRLFRLSTAFESELLPHLPELLRQKVAFEYLYGSQFVLWAYSRKGWDGVNELFSRPPRSTAQIFHPEKYYVKREEPLQIIPWKLLRELGARKIVEETLGEFTIRLLLARSVSEEEAEKVAAAWTGDTLLAFRDGAELILGWVVAWENPVEAREFLADYRRFLENRYGPLLEAGSSPGAPLVSRDGAHPLLLQIKDNFVFLLDGLAAPRSTEVAAGLWGELEATREPQQIPFDLVRRAQVPASARK